VETLFLNSISWIFVLVFLFAIGAIFGSFLNVVATRVATEREFLFSRSSCSSCGNILKPFQMIPIFSFLFLRGRCGFCKSEISKNHFLAEVGTGAVFTLSYFLNLDFSGILIYFVVSCFFIILFICDATEYMIPDKIAIPAIVCVGLIRFLETKDILNIVIAGVAGAVWFLVQFFISNGRWVGGGDIRIGVLMGVLTGFPMVFLALFLSYIFGAVIALYLMIFEGKNLKSKLPFATILLPCAFITWLWGDFIWSWYFNLIS